MPTVFSHEEYQRRLDLTLASMQSRGISALIIVDPSNMCWLTGFDAWSFYVHQGLIVHESGTVLWWGRPMDAVAANLTTWLDEQNIHSYSDDHVQNPDKHPMSFVSNLMTRYQWDRENIGLEMDNYYFTAAAYLALQNRLPNASFADANSLVNWCRSIKSEPELEFMQRAARIVEQMQAKAFELIEPGMRKCDLVASIYHCAISGTAEFGGDYPAIVPLLPSGAEAAAAHMTWTDKPLANNEGTFLELTGVYRRYHCPQSRTIFLGKPPQKFLDTEKAIVEGIQAALDAAVPGNTCEQVENAWRSTVARYGIEKESRIGYSTGLSYPPDWGERTMSFRPGDRSEIKENMVFHLIPAVWEDDWGMEISETFRITADGAVPLCNTERKLFIKD